MKRMLAVLAVGLLAAVLLPASASAAPVAVFVRAAEISTGEVTGTTRFGHTFRGPASGFVAGEFTVAFDYTPPNRGPGVTQRLTGGTWSLVTARGEVFGQFTSGTIQWGRDGRVALVRAGLIITGGFGAFAGAQGTGTLTGAMVATGGTPYLLAGVQLGR
jgi:hypothetical protein